jgi:Spy/CpxP family protein refolding chaperone
MDLAEAIGEVKTEGSKNRLGTMLRIRAELTPEQRQALVEIREEFRGYREGRGHHPRHHRRRGDPDDRLPAEEGESL